jgi:hypothetical protein
MTDPTDLIAEFLVTAHRTYPTACAALDQEVLTDPTACCCGVKEALVALEATTTRIAELDRYFNEVADEYREYRHREDARIADLEEALRQAADDLDAAGSLYHGDAERARNQR